MIQNTLSALEIGLGQIYKSCFICLGLIREGEFSNTNGEIWFLFTEVEDKSIAMSNQE